MLNPPEKQAPKLLDRIREAYNLGTEDAYLGWITLFLLFYNKHYLREMGKRDNQHLIK